MPTPSAPTGPDNSGPRDHGTTLSEYRASEGQARRLTRLRSLFDSIPPPNASSPSTQSESPAPSASSAAPESSASSSESKPAPTPTETERCARDRRTYLRELWGQCGSSHPAEGTGATPPQDTAPSPTTPSTAAPASPRPRPAATTATRWKAFEQYADAKERELWRAFCELDRDGDMRLRKPEVREACRRAGIELREDALDEFVRTVDRDGDGAISFDDWRDFLLVGGATQSS